MSNKKECLDASFAPATFNLRPPLIKQTAIKITERNEDIEKVLEFATADDYAAYKRTEAEELMTDKQKSVNVNINNMDKEKAKEIVKIVQSAIDSAELRCRRV